MKSVSNNILRAIIIVLIISMMLCSCSILMPESNKLKSNKLKSATIEQSITFGSLKIKIQKVVFSHYLGDNKRYSEADKGRIYCNVFIDVENVGTSDAYPRKYSFHLLFDDQYKYYSQWQSSNFFFEALSSIIPLETIEGTCLSFEVPEIVYQQNEKSLKLNLEYNSLYDDDYVEWIIR